MGDGRREGEMGRMEERRREGQTGGGRGKEGERNVEERRREGQMGLGNDRRERNKRVEEDKNREHY